MIRFKKRKVCKDGEHENIDVIMKWRHVENSPEWKNRACKKCTLVEGFQNDKEYLAKHCDQQGDDVVRYCDF